MNFKKYWEEDEIDNNKKKLAKETEISCVEDAMWEISLTRNKCCNDCRGLFDPCLTLLGRFSDQRRQEFDQEFQEQIEY